MQQGIKLFAGNASRALAERIANVLGLELGDCEVGRFSDGEISVNIRETVRGMDVFLVQSTSDPVNDSLMELLILTDACRRASAASVTAVIPYFGYARQDRKTKARDPITAKLVSDLIAAAGVDRVLTMDLHAPQIQGFFHIPVDHIMGAPILSGYFASEGLGGENLVVVSPDLGSVTRTRSFAARLGASMAIIDKRRQRANVSEVMHIIGEVEGKCCLLVDDMVDTAGTLCHAADALMQAGAVEVRACATHGVLSGPAVERLSASPLQEIVLLDTIALPACKRIPKIKVLSVELIFAEAIERIYQRQPVSPLFDEAPVAVRPIGYQERMKAL